MPRHGGSGGKWVKKSSSGKVTNRKGSGRGNKRARGRLDQSTASPVAVKFTTVKPSVRFGSRQVAEPVQPEPAQKQKSKKRGVRNRRRRQSY